MTNLKEVKRITAQLWKLGNKADDLGLRLPNGADVGALIGSLAADLENMLMQSAPKEGM